MSSIDDYLRWAEVAGLRDTTLYTSRRILERIAAEVGPLEAATADQLEAWWEQRSTMTVHTRRGELSRLRAWSAWAVEHGVIDEPAIGRLRAPRAPRRSARPIPEVDLERALAAATGRCRSWMLLGAYAGLRACECARLRPHELTATEVFVRDGKGGHAARLPAHPRLVEVVVDWPDDTAPWVVSHTVNRHLKRLGIESSMHKLRARFATKVHEASGNDILLTSRMMRHASPETTAIYVAWNPDAERAAVTALA